VIARLQGSLNHFNDIARMLDFDDQLFIAFVVKRDADSLVRVVYIPENAVAVVKKSPGNERTWQLATTHLYAFPPVVNS